MITLPKDDGLPPFVLVSQPGQLAELAVDAPFESQGVSVAAERHETLRRGAS